MPSILFINRVYPPEPGATGRVLEYAARGFVDAGWDVMVLTTAGARTEPGKSCQNGVEVLRIASPFKKTNLVFRALAYGLMIPALLWKALTLPPSEVVVTMTDPPMLLLIASFLKLFKRCRLIHWAQDLYPEVAEEAGVFRKDGFPATLLRTLSSWSLKSHDLILVIGRCMVDRLVGRGVPMAKIRVMPNSGVERDIHPISRGQSVFRQRHGLGQKFVIMYSGNMGRAHEFDTVIEAARLLQQECGDAIFFLLAGEGPEETRIRESVARLQLKNILFRPLLPSSDLSESLAMGDLHLVTMREGMSGLVVPSKFYGVMAAGRPTLFVGEANAEVARVIVEKKIGEVIAPGNSKDLVAAVLRYRNDPKRVENEGMLARQAVLREDFLPFMIREASRISLPRKALSMN